MRRNFTKVLVANRGEIAVRVAHSLRDLGLRSVAIFSEADRAAPHVTACDEATCVGPGPAVHSYLHVPAILEAARRSGAQAIHPGYGFLAENAAFAEAVEAAGLTFVGPPVAAMRTMGDKVQARAAMQAAGVPTVPGSPGALPAGAAGVAAARSLAASMGYPVMLKAAAGGGGKGMRLVHAAAQLRSALEGAASEAQGAFGDPAVYLEKAIVGPRHIEVQIFSCPSGTTYGLGERECSMQRRHQKVIEEAPAPRLDPELRQRMVEVACRAATAVAYRGAGTVEFLLDEAQNFYFLEMNTRLQVEHTVTEQCFGRDLVAAQLQVARGVPLGWRQAELQPRGHAIQARLYAEDPAHDFLPSPGRIDEVVWPHGPGVRLDAGVRAGSVVSRFYDPLLAKVTCWGEDRERARRRLVGALQRTCVKGIASNREFLLSLLQDPAFASGTYDTGTIAATMAASPPRPRLPAATLEAHLAAAAIATYRRDRSLASRQVGSAEGERYSAWRGATWRARGA